MNYKRIRYCFALFCLNQYFVFCDSDLSLSIAQGYNNDFLSGERSTFDISVIHNLKEQFQFSIFDFNFNSKLAAGVRFENGSKLKYSHFIPTDNEIFVENIIKYPAGWLIDPYLSTNARTQLTEAINVINQTRITTSNFRDPITTQQSIGLAFSLKDSLYKSDIRIGISLMQIRSEKFNQLTDDPKTFNIRERYKTKTGIDINNTLSYRLDKSATLTSKLSLFGDIENLDIWLVRFENDFNLMIWDIFGIIVRMNFIYDHNQMKSLQIQQSFRIGFIAKF